MAGGRHNRVVAAAPGGQRGEDKRPEPGAKLASSRAALRCQGKPRKKEESYLTASRKRANTFQNAASCVVAKLMRINVLGLRAA
jgi:hypothetical protein